MGQVAGWIVLGIVVFIVTNIDDIFLLMMFFSDNGYTSAQVVLGQYIGTALLVIIGLTGAFAALIIPAQWIGLMGLVPIALGVKKLYDLWRSDDDDDEMALQNRSGRWSSIKVLTIAIVCFSNGGDNIGVYIPFFASSAREQILVFIGVFVVMTALWCYLGFYFIRRSAVGEYIRRVGHTLLPFVLIALGLYILMSAFMPN